MQFSSSAGDDRWTNDRWTWTSDRVIWNNMTAGRRVLADLLKHMDSLHWSQREMFAVNLAVEESLVNAVRHGNHLDPHKRVWISCFASPTRVRVEITDEGPGFDPAAIPDPTTPERLDVPGGRGLLLIRAFMSHVEFRDCGRQVILERHRNQAA